MSFAGACRAKTSLDVPRPKGLHRHVVLDRKCNYSAFNGYRRTPSDYSLVKCVDTGMIWRTKAAYVDRLPDAKSEGEL